MDATAPCGTCATPLRGFQTIAFGDRGDRCYRCFNREMAEITGIDFDAVPFDPIVMADASGVPPSVPHPIVRPATDGRFSIVGLPAGEYSVAAVTAVEPDQLNGPAFLEQLAAMSFTRTIADGETKTQDLKLGGG